MRFVRKARMLAIYNSTLVCDMINVNLSFNITFEINLWMKIKGN